MGNRRVERIFSPNSVKRCRSEEECRLYCSDPVHFDECAAFAVEEGFLDLETAERDLKRFIEIEKFGPGQPGEFSHDSFPGGFDQVPSEFRSQVEEEFKAHLERFKSFGPHPESAPSPSSFEPTGDFPQPLPPPSQSDGSGGVRVNVSTSARGLAQIKIYASAGIESFHSYRKAVRHTAAVELVVLKSSKPKPRHFSKCSFPSPLLLKIARAGNVHLPSPTSVFSSRADLTATGRLHYRRKSFRIRMSSLFPKVFLPSNLSKSLNPNFKKNSKSNINSNFLL